MTGGDAASTGTPPATPPGAIPTVAWRTDAADGFPGTLVLADQTRLPGESVALECTDLETVRDAIQRLVVRGAPAIGVAAAYGLVLGVQGHADDTSPEFDGALRHGLRVGAAG